MLDVKRHDDAVSLLARVIASDPENGRAWCLLATALLGARRYRDAAAAAKQAVAVSPTDEWAHRLVSIAHVNLGDAEAAVRAAREACKQAPEGWRCWFCLAQAALVNVRLPYGFSEEEVAIAEHAAGIARKLAPHQADVFYISGRASFAREHFEQARKYQEKALALDPTHAGALNELGRISLKTQRLRRAADYFVRAAGAAPHVSAYSRNVSVSVWGLIAGITYITAIATGFLATVVFATGDNEWPVAASGLGAVAVLSAMLATWRFSALPRATRPLLRTRRVRSVLGAVYGSIIVAIVVSAAVPRIGCWAALAAAGVGLIALVYAAAYGRHQWGSKSLSRR
jgi:Flp pilus assembly protein TadD